MKLLSLELKNFRNHRDAKAELGGASTLLLGENGSGKTNWVEAAVLLSLGRSFRGARDRELIAANADAFEVRGVVAGRGGVTREILARGSREGAREVRVDGEPLARLTDLLGRFPTVHFSVEDVSVFGGGAAARRRFLDIALCQLESAYVGALRDYMAALKQRNRLLQESGRGPVDEDELGVWETILARSGLELDRRREALTAELHRRMRELAGLVDPGLVPTLEYVAPGEETAEARGSRLAAMRSRDRRLGWTADGPHRARLACRIAGRELGEGASRGYSRLYSILLRLAVARVLAERLDEAPVVLLDDPESELDARWIGPILGLIPESSQTVVTACRTLTAHPARFTEVAMESIAVARSAA
ncbi:MAG: DNA replication/repair protein RecF [Hyphomicrobiales bacterium]